MPELLQFSIALVTSPAHAAGNIQCIKKMEVGHGSAETFK